MFHSESKAMRFSIDFTATLSHFGEEPHLQLHVDDLHALEGSLSFQDYHCHIDTIRDSYFTQQDLEGVILKDLMEFDEDEFRGKGTVDVEFSRSFNGETEEYDCEVYLNVTEWKKANQVDETSPKSPHFPSFNYHVPDSSGEGMHLRVLNEKGKIYLQTWHNCLVSRKIWTLQGLMETLQRESLSESAL